MYDVYHDWVNDECEECCDVYMYTCTEYIRTFKMSCFLTWDFMRNTATARTICYKFPLTLIIVIETLIFEFGQMFCGIKI